MTLVLN